jgi:heme-degrading monooxygenase HmoA
MHARSTTIRGKPAAMDAGIGYVRDKVMPAVTGMDGFVGLSMLVDRDDGRCIVTTAWAEADAMHRSAAGVKAMRMRAAELMAGEAEVAEWDIALLHRRHQTHNGACARVIWTGGDPGRLDRLVDTFRMAMLPRIEELPGFASVSLMVDRTTGRTVTSISYDSRQSMAEAEAPGMALRQEFAHDLGLDVRDVAAFDIAVARLRVPETV